MAKIEAKMLALGMEEASCCGRIFDRGETMNAVVSDNGEPLGWYCDQCIDKWKCKEKKKARTAGRQFRPTSEGGRNLCFILPLK